MNTHRAAVALVTILAAGPAAGAAVSANPSQAISTAPPAVTSAPMPAAPQSGPELSAWGRQDDDGSIQSGEGAESSQPPQRQVHGEVSAGFGSGGYTGVSGVADIPVGQNSDLVVAGSRQSFDDRRFRGSAQSLSVGLFLNGAAPSAVGCGLPTSSATPAMDGYEEPSPGCGPGGAISARAN